MEITSFTKDQFTEYLALVDQEIRQPDSRTHAWEDFPVILDWDNRDLIFGITEGNRVAAGVACLVRQFQTSCGPVPVAGIGSVVTRTEFRGRGYSRCLQDFLLARLDTCNVPLAVLWTDQPEVYSRRGFVPAGWEFHVDLDIVRGGHGFPAGFACRDFAEGDVPAVSALYGRHPFRTLRQPGDDARLYIMPGTRGLVATGEGDRVLAAVFCGKGADFHEYVAEWSGPVGLVIPLLEEVRHRGWARHLIAPAGGQHLADQLSRLGATVTTRTSGLWRVVQPEQLSRYLQASGQGTPRDPSDPTAILGTVDSGGVVAPGNLTVAVWGFDSV